MRGILRARPRFTSRPKRTAGDGRAAAPEGCRSQPSGPLGRHAARGSGLKGNDRIVEQLLSRSADPNVVDATGKAAMTYAAARCFVEIVRRLLDAGVDANAPLRQ